MTHVLAIGAHPDDIELGCGATLVKHIASGDTVTMLVISNGELGPGETARRIEEQQAAADVLGVHRLILGGIADCEISLFEVNLVHLIEDAIAISKADVIYTHDVCDSHQDHRAVAHGTMGAGRHSSTILAYEAPSSLNFAPTVFSDVGDGYLDKKVEALLCHNSQVEASYMVSAERVRATALVRGHQARVGAAEGFLPSRMLISI